MTKTGEIRSARDLMVLGGGVDSADDGRFELSRPSRERSDVAGRFYQKYLIGGKAIVVCAGGISPIYQDAEIATSDQSEGELMAEYLTRNWRVPENVIRVESNSNTSTMNVVNSIRLGYLDPEVYDSEHPLAVATHQNHYRRVLADFADVGFDKGATFNIHPGEADSAVREMISSGIRAAFFAGVRTGDLDEMAHRNELLVTTIGTIGSLGGGALKALRVIRHSSS